MFYRMTVAGLERDLPICPVNENLYIAGFVIFGDQELTVACARELLKKAPAYDYIITAEAKGIPLVYEMARQADAKYLLAALIAKHFEDTKGALKDIPTADKVNSVTSKTDKNDTVKMLIDIGRAARVSPALKYFNI